MGIRRTRSHIIIAIFIMLLLVACNVGRPEASTPAQAPEEATPTLEEAYPPPAGGEIQTPYPEPMESSAYPAPGLDGTESSTRGEAYPVPEQPPAAEPDQNAYPAPQGAAPVPVVRTELEATDPGSVELASGDVQLVEFFAFW